MANYGDVALNLSPDWDRRLQHNQNYALWTIGHENGTADVYLEADPDARHQFAWVDPKRGDDVTVNQVKGYRFVKKADGWTKNPNLWGDWTPEGLIRNFDQLLMARAAALHFEDKAKRDRDIANRKDKDSEKAREIARQVGIDIDDDDQPVRRRRRA